MCSEATRRGLGAALLRKPTKLGRLVAGIAEGIPIPLTVKIRSGESASKINVMQVSLPCSALHRPALLFLLLLAPSCYTHSQHIGHHDCRIVSMNSDTLVTILQHILTIMLVHSHHHIAAAYSYNACTCQSASRPRPGTVACEDRQLAGNKSGPKLNSVAGAGS